MRILVIGGSGFIGQFVSRDLVAQGHSVVVMHRGRSDLSELIPGASSLINADPLSSISAMEQGLAARPDRVVHMLAMTPSEALAARTFSGKIERLIFASSGDVYRAYGRFLGTEPGPLEPMPLSVEVSPLRRNLYPYRSKKVAEVGPHDDYDKILVERVLMADPGLNSVALRLPKVYGQKNNRFETVYRFAAHPDWRWTHGYVENVAWAIVLALFHPASAGRIYNVGEVVTPTVAERLSQLPPSDLEPAKDATYDFTQDIVYDTNPIRRELGYREPISWEEGVRRTLNC
jgi:nucleoside-diphosphate-sugar epimerase